MKKYLVSLMLVVSMVAFGQDLDKVAAGEKYEITEADYNNQSVEMADVMRSNGKIYVVVGVITIVFVGIIFYAVRIDQKLTKIEREVFKEKVNS